MQFEDLPLREQKHARTRSALVDALIERISSRSVAEIAVSELAAAANISEATFFNHFKAKEDLLTFFIQVWSVEMAALARQIDAEQSSGLGAIEALFERTGERIEGHPLLMLELIAHQARMPADLTLPPLPRADRLLRLPGVEGTLDLPDTGLRALLPVSLARAIARGELPPRTDVQILTLALASIFFGAPLLLGRGQPSLIRPMYRAQLALLWAGARNLEVP